MYGVKPPGYHFPSLPPLQVVVEGNARYGVEGLEEPISISFCLNTARGSSKACIYSSPTSQNPPSIFFVTQTIYPPVNLSLVTIEKIVNTQADQGYGVSWHCQLTGRYQVVMIEYLQLGG